jgi:hypothetical protein
MYLREQFLNHSQIPHGFGYSAEMLIALTDAGFSYIEVPVYYNDRTSGTSTAVSMRNFLDIAGLFLRLLRRRFRINRAAMPESKLLSDRQ